MKKTVLFDLFDTLLRKERFDFEAIQACLVQHMPYVTPDALADYAEEYRNQFMANRNETMLETPFQQQLYFYEKKTGYKFDLNLMALEEMCFRCCRKDRMETGVTDTLQQLKKSGHRLGIISNSIFSAVTLTSYLRDFQIASYFDGIYSSADIGYRKPSPEIFHQACSQLDIAADREVLYIGNNLNNDIIGAENAGLTAIYYNRYESSERRVTIHHLKELPKIIEKLEYKNYAHSN